MNKLLIAFVVVGIIAVLGIGMFCFESPKQELTPRNNYGEYLLGMSKERQPTNDDVQLGLIKKGDEVFLLLESREFEDYGRTIHWRIE